MSIESVECYRVTKSCILHLAGIGILIPIRQGLLEKSIIALCNMQGFKHHRVGRCMNLRKW